MMEHVRYEHLLIFGSFMVAAWFIVIYSLPRMLLSVFKRAILVKGFGEGPVPINTLYTQPQAQFADPLHSSGSHLTTTGVNRDTLITIGWLDLTKGPQILHVPDMAGRYYSVQFTDPSKNTTFAYVGKRTTGTEAGAYLICGPGWKGAVPQGGGHRFIRQIIRCSLLVAFWSAATTTSRPPMGSRSRYNYLR